MIKKRGMNQRFMINELIYLCTLKLPINHQSLVKKMQHALNKHPQEDQEATFTLRKNI